ncbi:MAG: tetratricopeptide repeat protein [Saprospiraceae bacterium]|nr:tetratricopeptide repeat protein [Flavobacteriaceae bacterium]NNE26385.1 tetratricopeptide repeat protein [Saprospiraceae bacterium]
MKQLFLLLLSCFVLQSAAQSTLTAEQWQEDLKFLQSTIHDDYSFLFKKTTAQEFDKAAARLHKDIPNLEEHEIVVGLARLVSSFKYGHTVLGFRYQQHVGFHQLPLNMYEFNDGMYIQGVHKDYANTLGAKVIAVAGVPLKNALSAIAPVVPAENDQFFKAYAPLYLSCPEVLHAQGIIKELSQSVELTLEKNGKTFKQIFKALPTGERIPTSYSLVLQDENWLDARNQDVTPNYLKHLDKIYYYEYLPEQKTVYVRQSQIQDDPSEDIPTFYNKVFDFIENNDVEKLVIDVRLNGGGNNYKNKPVITGIVKTEKINQVGKLFVIIGRRTFSACQNLINEMSNYTNAIFVGEPSSENINFYGDNNRVDLPNSKIPAFLSFAWWQDKPQWENADWTAPHIAVDMSFDEYKTNKDPVLNTVLNFKGDDFVINPMAYFTNLFLTGKIDQLKTDAARMIKDPKYKFFNFEAEFNKAGYQLLGSGQTQEAIFVFQMVTQYFPDSANAWDSLAEGYLKAGDKEKATEYYSKAIKMDPNGPTGKNAREMLRTMVNNED